MPHGTVPGSLDSPNSWPENPLKHTPPLLTPDRLETGTEDLHLSHKVMHNRVHIQYSFPCRFDTVFSVETLEEHAVYKPSVVYRVTAISTISPIKSVYDLPEALAAMANSCLLDSHGFGLASIT